MQEYEIDWILEDLKRIKIQKNKHEDVISRIKSRYSDEIDKRIHRYIKAKYFHKSLPTHAEVLFNYLSTEGVYLTEIPCDDYKIVKWDFDEKAMFIVHWESNFAGKAVYIDNSAYDGNVNCGFFYIPFVFITDDGKAINKYEIERKVIEEKLVDQNNKEYKDKMLIYIKEMIEQYDLTKEDLGV